MHTEAPNNADDTFAQPDTPDVQGASSEHQQQQQKGPFAEGQQQNADAQEFASEHQVNNEPPGSDEAMLAQPLTSGSQQRPHQQQQHQHNQTPSASVTAPEQEAPDKAQ